MKLSDEQFFHTMEALGCGNGGGSQNNRAGIRVPMGTRATIIPCSENDRREPVTVVVMNLSEAGVGILNAVPMRSGENFILRLPTVGNRPAGAVLCSVVHVQSISIGMYAIGAQFARVLSVPGEQHAGPHAFKSPGDLAEQDLDHIRQVQCRLSRLIPPSTPAA